MRKKSFPNVAVVSCNGGKCATSKIERSTIMCDCVQAMSEYPDGILECEWGCMGLGSCVSVCKYDAIHINENGIAEVDREKCTACGKCAKICPKALIHMIPTENTIYPRCANEAAGAQSRKVCTVSCTACKTCVLNCPTDAIHIIDNHAVIDQDKCIACGRCATVCPRDTIVDFDGIFTPNVDDLNIEVH